MASTAVKLLTVLRPKGSYLSTMLGTSPIALWPLSETSGTSAADATGNGYTGTYSNVTLNSTTFPDGTAAGLWVPASSSVVTTYSAGLATAINKQEGTFACWMRVRAASVWTDSTLRWIYEGYADTSNRLDMWKPVASNSLSFQHIAGGTARGYTTTVSATAWFHIALTWSTTGSAVRCYLNGANVGGNLGAPGTFAGAVSSFSMELGRFAAIGAASWDGNMKYMGIWNRALTPAEVATLAPAPFLV
jgi:hypothetical protein